MTGIVLSLCDRTGVMVQPWLEAGYECWIVDVQHQSPALNIEHHGAWLKKIGADVRTWALPVDRPVAITFAFPPCTHLSSSGARWFKDRGLEALHESIGLVLACKRLCEASGAPWMLENPTGMLSPYWRKPDYTFQPWEYADTYQKRTCLWTGEGFRMPAPWVRTKPDGVTATIHLMPPSADRGDKRSVTPAGFARAVFEANHRKAAVA